MESMQRGVQNNFMMAWLGIWLITIWLRRLDQDRLAQTYSKAVENQITWTEDIMCQCLRILQTQTTFFACMRVALRHIAKFVVSYSIFPVIWFQKQPFKWQQIKFEEPRITQSRWAHIYFRELSNSVKPLEMVLNVFKLFCNCSSL